MQLFISYLRFLPLLSRPFYLTLVLIGLLLAGLVSGPKGALARDLPPCEGRDLLQVMKETNGPLYEKVIEEAEAERNGDGVFWKIEKAGAAPSYLLGTVHSTDPRVTALPPEAMSALKKASAVAVELADLDPIEVQKVMREDPQLFFTLKGEKLQARLSPGDYAVLVEEAKKSGIQANIVTLFKPWFASLSFFAVPACEKARLDGKLEVLDRLIVKWGQEAGAKIHSLETLREQYSAFASLPEDAQMTLLINGIHTKGLTRDLYVSTLEAYLGRRIDVIMPLSRTYGRDKAKTIAANEAFREALLTRRNETMVKRALPLLAAGNAFIAVGALHLIGDQGLVAHLRRAGYRVTKVY